MRERQSGQLRNGSFLGFHSYHLHNFCAVASKVVAGGRVSYPNMQCDLVVALWAFPVKSSLWCLFHVVPPWQVVIDKPHNIRKGVTKFCESLLFIENDLCLLWSHEYLLGVNYIQRFGDLAQ